jgi:transposase
MLQFEQRENIKFCQKLGKSASETFQMINQAYGEEALGRSAVFKWHKRFEEGRDSLEDDEHNGRPRMTRTELKIREVAALVRANRSHTVDEVAEAAGISHGTCHKILSDDLNMARVNQHSVPCVLKQERRDDRVSTCGNLIDSADRADKDGSFPNPIIGDKTWCFPYDPHLKRRFSTWESPSSPRKKKPLQDRSKGKVIKIYNFVTMVYLPITFLDNWSGDRDYPCLLSPTE